MVSQLVLYTIGPVQTFIAQARRTNDLYLGSRLLSHLAKQGVQTAAEHDSKLLYPVKINGKWPDSVPHRFMFMVDGDASQARKVVGGINDAITQSWEGIAKAVRQMLASEYGITFDEEIWDRQINGWLAQYHAIIEYDESRDDYRLTVRELNRQLAARKLVRHFPLDGEPGFKSGISGEREVLRPPQSNGEGDYVPATYTQNRDFWEKDVRQTVIRESSLTMLRPGERLDAIDIIKRLAHDAVPDLASAGRFPSTSSIAAASFRQAIIEDWDYLGDLAMTYLVSLRHISATIEFNLPEPYPYLHALNTTAARQLLRYDGDFFFEETLSPRSLKAYVAEEKEISEDARQNSVKLLRQLLKAAKDAKEARPHPYYAVLAMDGDKMGKIVAHQSTTEDHARLSARLANFADIIVRRIVEDEFAGRLVYSGGDDVLALLPVRDALAAADALRQAYQTAMDGVPYPDPNVEDNRDFKDGITASAGIAIVHHTHPLDLALQAARDAEKTAKKSKDEDPKALNRNAVVVKILRRSGEPREAGAKWQLDDAELGTIARLVDDLRQVFENDALSMNLPNDLDAIAYSMDTPAGDSIVPEDAREAEFRRVLRRRMAEGLSAADKQALEETFASRICQLAEVVRWQHAAQWVYLARFLAQAGGE